MIAIIDYRAGNLASVANALNRLDTPYTITDRREVLDSSDAVIFPGVGHAGAAMQRLREQKLDEWLRRTSKPVLGICLGMQLLYESTTEGPSDTLGILPGKLERFDPAQGKVPHMGWNTIRILKSHPLLDGIADDTYFYHVHSYFAPVSEQTLAESSYISPFATVAARDNFMGVQFHPEKSGSAGEKLLSNFVSLALRL